MNKLQILSHYSRCFSFKNILFDRFDFHKNWDKSKDSVSVGSLSEMKGLRSWCSKSWAASVKQVEDGQETQDGDSQILPNDGSTEEASDWGIYGEVLVFFGH